ncbi:YdcH family protein [Erythrobacter sp. YT30]|uniref:YdcH family protein n=1 Tax=Erythrobacter sp. YT30 TaxID=1735012 RepID=UPI00076CD2C7|nr:DUF465 domain-containing protein [Erythrobacter sp. YT30]KWV91629.1 hypothetical protein AUC45_10440 [Erythrobacter sp. YT30]
MSAHTPHQLSDEFPHDTDALHQLKLKSAHFRNLSDRYSVLNRSIHRIEVEVDGASDAYLTRLRKQRLSLLDEIAIMLEDAETVSA